MSCLESLVVAGYDLAEEAVVAASPNVRSGASAKLVTERKSRLPELLGRSRPGGYVSVTQYCNETTYAGRCQRLLPVKATFTFCLSCTYRLVPSTSQPRRLLRHRPCGCPICSRLPRARTHLSPLSPLASLVVSHPPIAAHALLLLPSLAPNPVLSP
jgi:hypothetical protein